MVKTEVSARVSYCPVFLNRGGLIGKRGNIPSGERAAGWRKWVLLSCPGPAATPQSCCAASLAPLGWTRRRSLERAAVEGRSVCDHRPGRL